MGTNAKYYIESGQAYYDITPLRLTITLSNNPFACSNNSNEITVTHANHNAISGDFVAFSGAATLGSTNITDVILNQEYRINEIVDSNSYKIIARNVSSVVLHCGWNIYTISRSRQWHCSQWRWSFSSC